MTRIKTLSARKFLEAEGFVPVAGRKIAGVPENWSHSDGRTARAVYGLVGRTGQSAGYTGWGWSVLMSEAGALSPAVAL